MLDIVKAANHYYDPSLTPFDPSSNARDDYKPLSIVVYVELIWDQDRYVINKVGQTTNLRERRKAKSYQNSHLKSVICLDKVPLSITVALREEYTIMVHWIVDPKNEVEPLV